MTPRLIVLGVCRRALCSWRALSPLPAPLSTRLALLQCHLGVEQPRSQLPLVRSALLNHTNPHRPMELSRKCLEASTNCASLMLPMGFFLRTFTELAQVLQVNIPPQKLDESVCSQRRLSGSPYLQSYVTPQISPKTWSRTERQKCHTSGKLLHTISSTAKRPLW